MLKELRIFQNFLESKNDDAGLVVPTFEPIGDLSVLASLNLYEVNQREGRYNALKKFYEVTQRILGDAEFRRIALGFVLRNPSQSFTLSSYHPGFPGFVKANLVSDQEFFFDLARFEWAWHRLSRTNFALQSERLWEKIPQCRPAATFLVSSPSVIVEKFSYKISPVYREWKSSSSLSLESIAQAECADHFVLFWRSGPMIRERLIINFWQAHLIKLALKNVSLDQIIFNIIQHSKLTPNIVTEFIRDLIDRKVIVDVRE